MAAQSEPLLAAAARIKSAEAVLIFTGAGMGADSGLGTYRGVNAGNFGIEYEEICHPKWFERDPELAWGFWTRCYQAYTRSNPHAGYSLLRSWGMSKALGCFAVTSNVDGHWLRSGMSEKRVWEVHGSVLHLQPCQKPAAGWPDAGAGEDDQQLVWPADPDVMAAMTLPEWQLNPQQVVQVSSTNRCSQSYFAVRARLPLPCSKLPPPCRTSCAGAADLWKRVERRNGG